MTEVERLRCERDRYKSLAKDAEARSAGLGLQVVALENAGIEAAARLGEAERDADRFRLALVAVCEAQDFEGAYAAAVDALRTPERSGQARI